MSNGKSLTVITCAIILFQIEALKALESSTNNGVQIIIERGQRSNRIRIIGLIEDVTDVTANVVKILVNTKLKEHEKDEAERLAKQVFLIVIGYH